MRFSIYADGKIHPFSVRRPRSRGTHPLWTDELTSGAATAATDALIVGFDSKNTYNLWRPYHAVRLADSDGNPATDADPTWNSLFLAPRFQEYISNHSVLTSSVMRLLARLLGDQHSFTLSSPLYPTFAWNFDRFSDAAEQVIEARIWGGIHFRTACELGGAIGERLADYILDHALLPRGNRGAGNE
jgi:hypothetical protein